MKNRNRWRRGWLLVVAALVSWTPALAVAQEFQKVTGPLREELPATPFVAAAYGFIWIALLAYVVWLARGVGRVRKDLAELRARIIEQADRGGPRP
jgi:CcmD family protein